MAHNAQSDSVRRARRARLSCADWVALVLCIFLVLFPKGGIKIGAVPLTWGYLLLAVSSVLALFFSAFRGTLLRTPYLGAAVLVAAIPFQASLIYSMAANGVGDWGFALSHLADFLFLPTVLLLLFRPWTRSLAWAAILTAVRWCIFTAAAYGVFLFVWRIFTGHLIEIPYLTVNAGDYGTIETEKYINRGGILKLISTYNNGNVYGVATITLLPLFDYLERSFSRKALLRVALVFTLSRTVWIGLFLDQFITFLSHLWSDAGHLPIIRFRRTLKAVAAILPVAGLLFAGLKLMSKDLDFLFDTTFGGRSEQFEAFTNFSFFPTLPVGDITEVVYASVLKSFGLTGLLSIALLFASPFLITMLDPKLLRNPLRRAALKGLSLYAALAWADGAITNIPVMAFYWFAVFLLVYGEEISASL